MRGVFGCTSIALVTAIGCAPGGARIEAQLVESYGWRTPGRGISLDATSVLREAGGLDERCRAVVAPWHGPALCGSGSVLRPARGSCSVFADMSPRLDPILGFFRADR